MSDEEDYQAVVDAAKRLLKAERDRAKKSERYGSMSFRDHSEKARAAASDRLTDACFELDKAKDWMHKVLVDAGLAKPHSRDSYETRLITHGCGFGHSIKFKYTPPIPRCYE